MFYNSGYSERTFSLSAYSTPENCNECSVLIRVAFEINVKITDNKKS